MRKRTAWLFLFSMVLLSDMRAQNTCALPPEVPLMHQLPPENWKGINYFPRGHAFYNMLNNWFMIDRDTGRYVYQMVEADMQMLSQNGFNFLHLYLWDNVWFGIGFNPIGENPCTSSNNQWQALDDFLRLAEQNGLYVGIHFVSQPTIKTLQRTDLTSQTIDLLAEKYVEWAGTFIKELSPRHGNIIMWGWGYALGPIADVDGAVNFWNRFLMNSYGKIRQIARDTAPTKGLGLIALNIELKITVQPGGHRFHWDASYVQRSARVILEMGLPEPDIYMFQFYNANSTDLERDLKFMTGSPLSEESLTIDAKKILVVEFGTSTSLSSPPYGMNLGGAGDAHTPSLTIRGHSRWLKNTLCAFNRTGIQKFAHWTLYDAYDFWAKEPFDFKGELLAWSGYWGLLSFDLTARPKPSWETIIQYIRTDVLSCSKKPKPVIFFEASPPMACPGDKITLTWAATDVDSLEILEIGEAPDTFGHIVATKNRSRNQQWTLIASGSDGSDIVSKTVVVRNNCSPRIWTR